MPVTEKCVLDRLEKAKKTLEKRTNISGITKVLKNIDQTTDLEEKLDHIVLLETGCFLSNAGAVNFENELNNTTPHDIVLNFREAQIVVEVKRIRETSRHKDIIEEMEKAEDFIEIKDKGEFRKLISKILDEKHPQLEDDYLNIIFLVSKDINYRADNVQDASCEIKRYLNKFFYPENEQSQYNNLHALFFMDENTGNISGNIVFKNDVIVALMKKLEIL